MVGGKGVHDHIENRLGQCEFDLAIVKLFHLGQRPEQALAGTGLPPCSAFSQNPLKGEDHVISGYRIAIMESGRSQLEYVRPVAPHFPRKRQLRMDLRPPATGDQPVEHVANHRPIF